MTLPPLGSQLKERRCLRRGLRERRCLCDEVTSRHDMPICNLRITLRHHMPICISVMALSMLIVMFSSIAPPFCLPNDFTARGAMSIVGAHRGVFFSRMNITDEQSTKRNPGTTHNQHTHTLTHLTTPRHHTTKPSSKIFLYTLQPYSFR